MRSCLRNCKPGDIIHCTGNNNTVIIFKVREVTLKKVELYHLNGKYAGYFDDGNQHLVIKIVKKSK